MSECLFCGEPVVGVVGTELRDEVDAGLGGVLQQGGNPGARLVGEVEFHVPGLAVCVWGGGGGGECVWSVYICISTHPLN